MNRVEPAASERVVSLTVGYRQRQRRSLRAVQEVSLLPLILGSAFLATTDNRWLADYDAAVRRVNVGDCNAAFVPVHCRLLQLLVEAAVGLPAGGTSAAAAGQPAAFTPPGELAGLSCCWNDSHAVLMRSLLDSCPRVATSQMDTLVAALKAAAQQPGMAKSASFGQLLMAVVKNYGAVLTKQQVEQLLEAAAATSTFMTKSVVTKLQQLAEQHAAAGGVLQP